MDWLSIGVAITSIAGGVIALIALFITIFQFVNVKGLNKTNAIIFFVTKMLEEKEIKETINMLDVDPKKESKGWYNKDFYSEKNREFAFKIDKTLTFLSYICYLLLKKRISYKEFSLAEYKVNAVLLNTDVKKYLWNLYCYSDQCEIDNYAFGGRIKLPFKRREKTSYYYLIKYGLKTGMLKKDFVQNISKRISLSSMNNEEYKTKIIG